MLIKLIVFCRGNGTKPTVDNTETYISVLHESDDTSGCTQNVWDIQINTCVDLQRTLKPRSRSLQHIRYKGKQKQSIASKARTS